MKEPKYKIGDKVWILKDGEATEEIVKGVYLAPEFHGASESVMYFTIPNSEFYGLSPWLILRWKKRSFICNTTDGYYLNSTREGALFPTKQDLINPL